MSVQAGETPSSVLAFAPKKERPDATEWPAATTVTADDAGHGIIALLQKAADMAKSDCERAMSLAHKFSLQVRAAEERAQPPRRGQRRPRKERANLKQGQTIFATVRLARKNGSSEFRLKSIKPSSRTGTTRRTPTQINPDELCCVASRTAIPKLGPESAEPRTSA
jgi:hypothetical protein